jgi:hypothetical protein
VCILGLYNFFEKDELWQSDCGKDNYEKLWTLVSLTFPRLKDNGKAIFIKSTLKLFERFQMHRIR